MQLFDLISRALAYVTLGCVYCIGLHANLPKLVFVLYGDLLFCVEACSNLLYYEFSVNYCNKKHYYIIVSQRYYCKKMKAIL